MQALTVDVFLSVDGWASGATSPGYFGYLGPELEEWITAEVALPQLVVTISSPRSIGSRATATSRSAPWEVFLSLDNFAARASLTD